MKRLIQFAALSALALPVTAAAQKAPVYDCWVLDAGNARTGYVTLGIAKDSIMLYKQDYPAPPDGMPGIKSVCRAEIAKLQLKEAAPIVEGKVDLSAPAPSQPPPVIVPPTQDELDLAAFLGRVELVRRLAIVVPADDKDLADMRTQIAMDLKTHPEWKDSL